MPGPPQRSGPSCHTSKQGSAGVLQDRVDLINVLHAVSGLHVRGNVGVLQLGEVGVDVEGGAEAHADGADDVPGEGIAHIGTAGGVRLDLMEGDQKNVGVWLAISGDGRKRHILEVVPDARSLSERQTPDRDWLCC